MKRLMLIAGLFLTVPSFAKTILVKNIIELNAASKNASPGDLILLQNGQWNNVSIVLDCIGTKEKPITFRAQNAGKVIITGQSFLKLGGNYIVVDGLFFTNGYSGKDHVIDFRSSKDKIANNCRITNCAVVDFNNPKRMQENYWVSFYGKQNRLDHCSFIGKKNMGVLLAVILDDERSRENFHSIDHNYFGQRIPLASNSGEIMRVGVSQHCQFNSNTQIVDNYFENCDGETEIVSIKSGSNVVRNNLFKECQGGVVLRHGNDNIVENNIFLGNDKDGTGGVRVINKGQWVVNNFFYKCRGVDFRSPLSIMNGIPNSPAHRYVQVTDAVIANNTFFNCSSISFGEGSDAERTLAPENVFMANNIFYNNRDSIIYTAFDRINGISFRSNLISPAIPQQVAPGFVHATLFTSKNDLYGPVVYSTYSDDKIPDSIQVIAKTKLGHDLSAKQGFTDLDRLKAVQVNAGKSGANWYKKPKQKKQELKTVNCNTASELYQQLQNNQPVNIRLTGEKYQFDRPLLINSRVSITGNANSKLEFASSKMTSLLMIAGNGSLLLNDLNIDGKNVQAGNFISSDTSGSSGHYNLSVTNSTLRNFTRENGCQNLFFAYKSIVADSIIFRNNSFLQNNINGIIMNDEKDDKGYYSSEKIIIGHNLFDALQGTVLEVYRGGNDESTMGPILTFSHNKIKACNTTDSSLIKFTGVQRTSLFGNDFTKSNNSGILIRYKDTVRARHLLENNEIIESGKIEGNNFLVQKNNQVQ